MNWVDWLIIVFVLIGLWHGFWRGFVALLFQLVSLILAIFITLWTLPRAGNWMETQLHIPVSYARPIGLAILFFVSATFLSLVGNILHKLIAPIVAANPFNRLLGLALGGVRQLIIAGMVLTLLVTAPIPTDIKASIDSSGLAKPLIQLTLKLEQAFEKQVDTKSLDSIAYRTVGKDESTTTSLNFTIDSPKEDLPGEATMLALTNEIRKKQNLPALMPNTALRNAARNHAEDMLKRGYFSHYSPQGEDVLKRVQAVGGAPLVVGENLANAPTVIMAQAGLLASKDHRDNILNAEFNEVGIAVYDAGVHGKMVVEVFGKMP